LERTNTFIIEGSACAGRGGGAVKVKTCLHIHTTEGDGKGSPREMVEAYLKAGFGAVAITDHDTITDPPEVEGIIVFEGVEHSTYGEDGIREHWLEIMGEKGVLAVKAHPNRYGDTCQDVDFGFFDNVEATEHATLHAYYFGCKTPVVFTDDAHSIRMVNRAWILVDVYKLEKDEILKAIKEQRYTLGGVL